MKQIKQGCYKGTRILVGTYKRMLIDMMTAELLSAGYNEIQIPIIQPAEVFEGKIGAENQHMMYRFTDQGGRDLCLAPEYTAVIQQLAKTEFKNQKDVRLFYVAECFRGEKPQAGRYRQFTQLGVEILNPSGDKLKELRTWAWGLFWTILQSKDTVHLVLNKDVTRGLDYYKDGKGFEITCDALGAAKQICGGGEYEGGVGFAIGVDRLLKILYPEL